MRRPRPPSAEEVSEAALDPRMTAAFEARGTGPGWRTQGACVACDPELFFPATPEPVETALTVCRGCTVQAPCLAAALEAGGLEGVWGATTARERRAMHVVWRSATSPA